MNVRPLLFLASFLLIGLAAAEAAPTLALKSGDVRRVQIELEPGKPAKLNVYFTPKKLAEAKALISANLDQPISIEMNGRLAAQPRLKQPLLYKTGFLSLAFPDLDGALDAARVLVPTR